jgi:hypothetical protein
MVESRQTAPVSSPAPSPKHLRSVYLNSDGSPAALDTFEYCPNDLETGQPYAGENGRAGVGFVLRRIPPEEFRKLQRQFTAPKYDETTKAIVEVFDREGFDDELMRQAITDWWGIHGANDRPLVCNNLTKPLVPDVMMRAEIRWKVTRSLEPVSEAVREASFREPASVRAVGGGVESNDAVLPASDTGRATD